MRLPILLDHKLKCVRYIDSMLELGYSKTYVESAAYDAYGDKVGSTFISEYIKLLDIQ